MNASTNTSFVSRYGKLLIAIVWISTTAFYLHFFGIGTTLEAEKYIDQANNLLQQGHFSETRFWFYSLTIFIIAFAIKIKIGLTGAFVIQALLNLVAYLVFYKALKKIFQHAMLPLAVVVYLMLFWPYQSWVVYLYTEAAFFSSMLLLFSALVLAKPDSIKSVAIILGALLLTLISRPLGILLGISVYLYFFYSANKKWRTIIACCSIVLLLIGYYSVNIIFSTIGDWSITKAFEEENIICNLPAAIPTTKLNLTATGSPIYQLGYYITHNFTHFLHFAGIKLRYFFFMRRDYYNKAHNYFLLLNIIPVYTLALISCFMRKDKLTKGITVFILSSIILYAITIILQCDDYHNRFILSIYPLFVVLAAVAIDKIIKPRGGFVL